MTIAPQPTDYPETVADGLAQSTIYSTKFASRDVSELGFTGQTTGTIDATLELWGTNKINPGEGDDADWFLQSCQFPTNPTGGAWKDSRDVASANLFWYRWKLVLNSGTGTWTILVNRKGLG